MSPLGAAGAVMSLIPPSITTAKLLETAPAESIRYKYLVEPCAKLPAFSVISAEDAAHETGG